MREIIRAALVIARRDYAATVFSKTFVLFLLFPLLPVIAGVGFGAMGASQDRETLHPTVAVIAAPETAAAIGHAGARLSARLGPNALPRLRMVMPDGTESVQVKRLLADGGGRGVVAVLTGGLDRPTLTGSRGGIGSVGGDIGLVLDSARQMRALDGQVPPVVDVVERPVDRAAGTDRSGRTLIARAGQFLLMFLTMILAGMLLSNMIEEKSSKVIEVLAAAVPVDAIFLGKLFAMLAMSFTGIAVWGGAVLTGLALAAGQLPAVPAPAVGWPLFLVLGLAYFTTLFLLLGALFIGIGGQAASPREVQMMSLPVTMGQMGVLAFASSSLGAPQSAMGIAAALFPWSSPFAMLARAAQGPALWPHLLAIVWQLIWVAVIVRIAAGLFRRSVLKSGGGGWLGRFRRRGMKPAV
ncbi:ABC transporter permease [Sphingomonas arantia]|uniref:ABC transporter permease n=1 Tax=Sphingomonas arantia TaxID=1460676 RepID=A0ABW4U3Z3_9SPHN